MDMAIPLPLAELLHAALRLVVDASHELAPEAARFVATSLAEVIADYQQARDARLTEAHGPEVLTEVAAYTEHAGALVARRVTDWADVQLWAEES